MAGAGLRCRLCSDPPVAGAGGVGGLRWAQSCPFPPLVVVSLWVPVSLWGMYACTAAALYEEELLSYKSLLFKHYTPFWVVFDIRNFL